MSPATLTLVEVRYLTDDGDTVETTAAAMDLDRIAHATPLRRFSAHRKQRHYSGLYWSMRTNGHVPYESRLERSRLQLADFDARTTSIAAQPMQLAGVDGDGAVRHVPDFFITRAGAPPLLVDVKPAEFAALPKVARVFAWTRDVCRARGIEYEVWTGERDRMRVRNVQALAVARRRPLPSRATLARLLTAAAESSTIGELEALEVDRQETMRAAWEGLVEIDLDEPLSLSTTVTTTRWEQP